MTEVRHPIFARLYARFSADEEAKGGAELRDELLAGLAGRVVEVGAGHGLNFAHFPIAVTEVVAIEPEPHLRELASEAAARAPVPVTLVDGVADSLPLPDASCDAAVCSLVLCSVADPDAALAEVRRVLRPGGGLRFYEHVLADTPGLARVQRVINVAHPLLAGGCHITRDTEAAIERAGFEIVRIRRFRFAPMLPSKHVSPKILGTARLPS